MDYFRAGTANYSVYTIPAYYLLCMVPHIYAGSLLKAPSDVAKRSSDGKVKPGKLLYNMPNPRSAENNARYSSVLDKSTFARWERARASHNNMLESAPFVVSAFVLGIMTKVPAEDMNIASALYLASRVLYIFSYIGVERGIGSVQRTAWFFAGIGVLISLWVKAGKKVIAGDY